VVGVSLKKEQSYSEVSIGDTQEHQLGIYPEKESLCLNKPRGASPLGQFLLVGPLFLCVEKVRGRK
jgi:hypothetical protein